MDDRELEARLRARLHRRFDVAEPPDSLVRAVEVQFAARPSRELPRFSIAALAAAAVLIAAVAVAINGGLGPVQSGASPTAPAPTAFRPTNRQYIVLPPAGSNPTKADGAAAFEVLRARLEALGAQYPYAAAQGYAITFTIPIAFDSPEIRTVLSATGDLSFVPLPPADYSTVQAVVGQPLPKAEPALFGSDAVAGVGVATTAGSPTAVHFTLTRPAAAALEIYTSEHIGETMAILLDGKVALLPVIQSMISDGRLEVSAGSPDTGRLTTLAAIVSSGRLPESWSAPLVPNVIAEQQARDLAFAAHPGGTAVVDAELTTLGTPTSVTGLVAAWAVRIDGVFPMSSCSSGPPPGGLTQVPCGSADSELVYLDAVTGALLETHVPAP